MKKALEKSHTHCMVCGQNNDYSWKLKFSTDRSGKTCTQFQGDNNFQGYNGILYGGIITTLLDATMTHCLFYHGIAAFTGDLRVRFVHPIPYDAAVHLQAQIVKTRKSIYVLRAEAIYQQKIMAWAEAIFVQMNFNP
jgi:acyl-coenzyme A thioesterase PaaI-like protein